MEQYKCPYCKSKLDYLRYTAEFIESGYVFGTYDIHRRYNEVVDRDYNHEEESNEEYECPECEEVVTLDELVLVTEDSKEDIKEINNSLLKKRNIDIVPF
jgi:ribosomal protein L37AE/L43A